MNAPADLHEERVGHFRLTWREPLTRDQLLEHIDADGEVLKDSRKACIRRVGEYVVKNTRSRGLMSALKHLLQPARHRQGWTAALALEQRGIPAPRAVALVEVCWLGCVYANVIVSEYLDGYINIEDYLADRLESGWGPAEVDAYLEGIARHVNDLCAAGVYHNDLAGKNILTRDGRSFVFIDLDGIVLDRPYTEDRRFKNHVQLYDSLLDHVDHDRLVPFLHQMLPDSVPREPWIDRVVAAQRARRERTLKKWAVEGRTKGA